METRITTTIEQEEVVETMIVEPYEQRWTPAVVAIELGSLCMRFARIDRVPRYADHERESDVEHSYMLSVAATELAHLYYPALDTQLVGAFANVHDLIEVVTGDVATFTITAQELAEKEAAEKNALDGLLATLPPYTADLLKRYEHQEEPEARFVRAVDKLMPVVVDVIGQGEQVMREDYNVTTIAELKESHVALHARIAEKFGEFQRIVAAHRQLCDLFEAEFAAQAAEAIPTRTC